MEMFGRADSTLPMLAMRPYDHYVLCSPDFEFVQDGTRRDSRLRERQHAWYLEESAREQRAGFPTIRAIPSYVSLLFLEFAAGCEEREIRSMSWSRQRRPWPGSAAGCWTYCRGFSRGSSIVCPRQWKTACKSRCSAA